MAIINEEELIERFDKANKILLVEPEYPKQLPPFALAKIKTYLVNKGKTVKFARHITSEKFDLIGITTLFTYYSAEVFKTIRNKGFFNRDTSIVVGGVFASLMPDQFSQFKNVDVFKGYSKIIDMQIPDPEIMGYGEEKWNNFSWAFTTRGCPNKCAYCSVWRIEPDHWINKNWKNSILPGTKALSLMDNNIASVDINHLRDIINFVNKNNMKLMIQSGIDCKHVTPELAKLVSSAKYTRHGMRTAFDRIEEDGIYQKSIELMQKHGANPENMMAYVLFNFNDRPHDANYRAEECKRLKVRAYPQCYSPLNVLEKNSNFVGKHWTKRLTKAFRTFWIMKGIRHGFTGIDFGDYIKSNEGRKKYKLTNRDLDFWNSNGRNK